MAAVGTGREPGDDELVLLTRDGSIDAFNSLVDRHQDHAYSLCYRLLGDRQAAEDATQDAFLSAYRSIASFRGGSFRSWLLRIAANAAKDELRRRGRKPAASLDELRERPVAPLDPADDAQDTAAEVERLETSAVLEAALATLPIDQRQVIVLLDVMGYRYEEIAVMTRTSLGTVKSRVFRGREKMRDELRKHPELLAPGWRLKG